MLEEKLKSEENNNYKNTWVFMGVYCIVYSSLRLIVYALALEWSKSLVRWFIIWFPSDWKPCCGWSDENEVFTKN